MGRRELPHERRMRRSYEERFRKVSIGNQGSANRPTTRRTGDRASLGASRAAGGATTRAGPLTSGVPAAALGAAGGSAVALVDLLAGDDVVGAVEAVAPLAHVDQP